MGVAYSAGLADHDRFGTHLGSFLEQLTLKLVHFVSQRVHRSNGTPEAGDLLLHVDDLLPQHVDLLDPHPVVLCTFFEAGLLDANLLVEQRELVVSSDELDEAATTRDETGGRGCVTHWA
eukprot:scaffold1964_cov252-Isochrysis_galbana.AAC.2